MTKMAQNYRNLRGGYSQNGANKDFSSKILGIIETRRRELRINKGDLAVKLNLSRKQFKRIEQGKITLVELEAIFRALNLTILILPSEHINTI